MKFKTLIAIFSFFSSVSAFAGFTRHMTIINQANTTVACSTIVIDREARRAITYNWFVVSNGQQSDLGPADFYYCEEMGNPKLAWGGYDDFCVSSPRRYTNPIFDSSLERTCKQVDGDMAGFDIVPDNYESGYAVTLIR